MRLVDSHTGAVKVQREKIIGVQKDVYEGWGSDPVCTDYNCQEWSFNPVLPPNHIITNNMVCSFSLSIPLFPTNNTQDWQDSVELGGSSYLQYIIAVLSY